MSEEDKVLKRKKIEKNRAKKRSQSDNAKASKIKKDDCVDDCAFEDTSMSVNSVASTMSETYFWESDRKYADLDGNRQNVVESMSPVTAASVPSPSSPPESTNIAETKTLDMLKESAHGSRSSFARYGQLILYADKDVVTEARRNDDIESVCSRARLADFGMASQNAGKDKISLVNAGKYEQTSLEFNPGYVSVNGESAKYGSQYEESTSSYSKFEQSHEQESPVYVNRASNNGRTDRSDLDLAAEGTRMQQPMKEEATICQKSKEMCSSGNSLVAKFKQDPDLLAKFVSNPNLVAKIFQDRRVIIKIMTDPDMATCLATDPHVTQFLKENGVIDVTDHGRDRDNDKMQSDRVKTPENNIAAGNTTRYILKSKGSHVENPILTDLITNRNAEECKNQNLEAVTSADWNKNTADVTRDVLQDVQRYE